MRSVGAQHLPSGNLIGTPRDDLIIVPLLPPTVTGSVNVVGGPGNDTIVTAFAAHANTPFIRADGGPGNDWIDTNALNPMPSTIIGGAGDDTLIGGGGGNTIIGFAGRDTIWMAGGDTIFTDGRDRLFLDVYAGGGTVTLYGATAHTVFDFTSLVPVHLESPSGNPMPEPFTITRGDLSFDPAGNLQVDHTDPSFGSYHLTLAQSPYHDDASLDAAIASGHVLLK